MSFPFFFSTLNEQLYVEVEKHYRLLNVHMNTYICIQNAHEQQSTKRKKEK